MGFLARRRISYSVGFKLPDRTPDIYAKIPKTAWAPAYNADGDPSQGADVRSSNTALCMLFIIKKKACIPSENREIIAFFADTGKNSTNTKKQ